MKCHIDKLNLYNTNCTLGTKLKYHLLLTAWAKWESGGEICCLLKTLLHVFNYVFYSM